MLTHRAMALTTLLCLLIGLLAVPRGPILVCRITGTPMVPVLVNAADEQDTCCAVEVSLRTPDILRYALTAPGCCELRQDVTQSPVPAIPVASPDYPAAALIPAPLALPAPVLTVVATRVEAARESAPRAPPVLSASPRAPPFFS